MICQPFCEGQKFKIKFILWPTTFLCNTVYIVDIKEPLVSLWLRYTTLQLPPPIAPPHRAIASRLREMVFRDETKVGACARNTWSILRMHVRYLCCPKSSKPYETKIKNRNPGKPNIKYVHTHPKMTIHDVLLMQIMHIQYAFWIRTKHILTNVLGSDIFLYSYVLKYVFYKIASIYVFRFQNAGKSRADGIRLRHPVHKKNKAFHYTECFSIYLFLQESDGFWFYISIILYSNYSVKVSSMQFVQNPF